METFLSLIRAFGKMILQLFGTLLPAALTTRSNKRKTLLEKKERLHELRPEMKITEYKSYLNRKNNYGIKAKSDVSVLMSFVSQIHFEGEMKKGRVIPAFCEGYHDSREWRCVVYRLENAGKTSVSTVYVISRLKKELCLYETEWVNRIDMMPETLNYSVYLDRKLYPGDSFVLKLCYHKNMIRQGFFNALLYIGMIDDNGRRWVQPLFAPDNKIYDSRSVSSKQYEMIKGTSVVETAVKADFARRRKKLRNNG